MKTLYPYQEEGVEFLRARRRAYLADEMGLGKTAQACVAASHVLGRGGRARVIAPASALDNWSNEWDQWAGQWGHPVFVSWAARDFRGLGDPDLVILDEAHYAKNPKAARTRSSLALAARAPIAWCLSGTPNPKKHLGELYTVFRALAPEACRGLGLETYDEWFDHFCDWTHVGPFHARRKRVYGVKNTADLRPYLRDFMLRRTLNEVEIELPELRVDTHRLPRNLGFLSEEQCAAYRQMVDLEGGDNVSALRHHLGTYKAPLIAEVVAEELRTDQYEKIVVMAYHHDVLDIFRRHLEEFGVTGFDGSTPGHLRQPIIQHFADSPGKRVFVVQQVAGGTAIDGLQASSEVVLAEPDFVPDQIRQQIKRIHRIGSTRPCRARMFAVTGTMDEGVLGTLAMRLRHEQEIGL